MQAGRLRYKDDDRRPQSAWTNDPAVLATRIASSTVGTPQSVSKAIFTPTSRKVAAGPARRGFPRAGGRGVGAGKMKFEGVGTPGCSPPARRQARSVGGWWDRGTLAFRGHAIRERVAAVEDRGRRAFRYGSNQGTACRRLRNRSGGSKPVIRKTSSPPEKTITVGTPITPYSAISAWPLSVARVRSTLNRV